MVDLLCQTNLFTLKGEQEILSPVSELMFTYHMIHSKRQGPF